MRRFIITLCTLGLASFIPLHAQQDEDRYNESVVVKGTYRPVIEQAEKIHFPATITDTLSRIGHSFQYSISPTRLRSKYEPTRIRAARVVGEPATRLYNNYLHIGLGNYWSPLADLYWASTRDRLKTYGISLNHLSSWGKITNYGPNHYGNTALTLFGKYIVKDQLQLFTDLSYEHDHHLYYGGLTDSLMQATYGTTRADFAPTDYRASYNIASWRLGMRNMELDPNQLGYSFDATLTDLWTIYGINELGVNAEGDIHYGFNLAQQYKGVAYLRASYDFVQQLFQPNGTMPIGYAPTSPTDTLRHLTHIVRINPFADFMMRGLQFHAGLTTGWRSKDTASSLAFYLLPDVVISRKMMHEKLVLSLAATGGVEANSINSIRQTNPYVIPDAMAMPTLHYDFTFHARWTLSKKLEANAEAQYALLRNDLTFTPIEGTNGLLFFRPFTLDDNRLTVGANIAFVNDEMITLRAAGHYYLYQCSDLDLIESATGIALDRLPYRPSWDALISADINYHDRWLGHLETGLLGSTTGYYGTLPLRYGVAAEVEYRHNRALSFFLRVDNLAFQRYMLWDRYPSQRALLHIGLTYTI